MGHEALGGRRQWPPRIIEFRVRVDSRRAEKGPDERSSAGGERPENDEETGRGERALSGRRGPATPGRETTVSREGPESP